MISETEMQNVEFVWLCFDLALVQYFVTVFLSIFPHFGTVMYILCHCILAVCNYDLLLDLDIAEGYS